jgi:hypothetical protein
MILSGFSISSSSKTLGRVLGLIVLVISTFAPVRADLPPPELLRMFPADIGGFHQIEPARQIVPADKNSIHRDYSSSFDLSQHPWPILLAQAEYASAEGEKLRVAVTKWENDSTAYSNLTGYRKYFPRQDQAPATRIENVGTAGWLMSAQSLAFFKGQTFVVVTTENAQNADRVKVLARAFAETLDPGEGDVPVLVKHLPNSEVAGRDAIYAVNSDLLLQSIPNQPILKEVSFEGGTEAVTASYGQSQMVIVEFTTPQFSVENDQRIWTKIAELKSQGQPVPIAYRRVGNYSVFVFNAPDEKTANALVDQVKYEQVVQWLGDDPRMAERLQRYFRQTSAGVLLAVLKSSGLSLLLCLGVGTLFGALLFRRRLAQQATLYSDAGGATRLNLDELTDAGSSHRLLGRGKQPDSDS